MAQVIRPAIAQMRSEGVPFTGFLYAGLMMTAQGPKVIEFNARLGDPETQALMHRMASDFVGPLYAAAHGALDETPLDWKADPSVCVVLAAHGYPGSVRTGDAITGLDQVHDATVAAARRDAGRSGRRGFLLQEPLHDLPGVVVGEAGAVAVDAALGGGEVLEGGVDVGDAGEVAGELVAAWPA